jgi:hypothetical protein
MLNVNIFLAVSCNDDVQVHYKWHVDVDAALRGMPRHLTVERAIVSFRDLFASMVHVTK